jgi:hypothetical protein
MPSLSIQYNPKVGPLLQVAIFPIGFTPQTGAVTPLNPTFYMSLIDTGASCTCITEKVIRDVGLSPVGKQQVGGVHGSGTTNAYQFQLGLIFPTAQLPTGVVNVNLTLFPVNGIEFKSLGGFDVLLGRDILCQGAFSMSFDGHAILSI